MLFGNQGRWRWRIGATSVVMALAAMCGTAQAQGLVAYRGGTLETVSPAGRIEQGVLLVRDGRIEAMGAGIAIPETARIVDVSGQTIMPALVDAYHPIALAAGAAPPPETRTIVIRGRTITVPVNRGVQAGPFLRVADSLDPVTLKTDLAQLARTGIGLTNLVTSGYGQAAHARVTPQTPATSVASGDGYLFMTLSNDSSSLGLLRSGLGGERPSGARPPPGAGTRFGGGGRRRPSGSPEGTPLPDPAPRAPESSVAGGLWTKVRDGQSRLIVNVNNAAAILHLLKELQNYEKVSVVLIANSDHVFQTLDAIQARKNLTLVMRPEIALAPFSRDRINVARLAAEAGIDFSFCLSLRSDLPSQVDAPLFPVAQLVRSGLPRDVALEALTLRPARTLGVADQVGSLEQGKTANLLFFNGDPLDPASRLIKVVVEGNTVHEG